MKGRRGGFLERRHGLNSRAVAFEASIQRPLSSESELRCELAEAKKMLSSQWEYVSIPF